MMILSTNITFSDWTYVYGTWGIPGVRKVIDLCLAGGIRKIYWRFFDGGIANYHSKIERIANGMAYGDKNIIALRNSPGFIKQFNRQGYAEAICQAEGYKHWDPIGEAIEYAHRNGLEIYAWVSLENDHGGGVQSRLAEEHPEYAHVDRWGNVEEGCLSFSFPEVRRYKIMLIREIVQMPIDGLWLDFCRCAPGIKLDETGVNILGYEQIAVEEFKEKFQIDPRDIPNNDERWINFRARYSTLFVSELQAELKKLKWERPVYADIPGSSVETSLAQKFTDVQAWCAEKLVNGLVAGYYGIPVPTGVKKVFRRRIWKAHPDIIEQLTALCCQHGFDEVMFQEADNLHTENLWNTTARIAISPCLPSKPVRGIKALKIDVSPDIDIADKRWEQAEIIDSFIEHTRINPAYAPVKTEARVLWSAKHLHIRIKCFEEMQKQQIVSKHKIVGGSVFLGNNGLILVCLDTNHDHQTCSIFQVNQNGKYESFQRNHDEPLEHWGNCEDDSRNSDIEYQATVTNDKDHWTAMLTIPLKNLGTAPKTGALWGLNICRFIPPKANNEVKTTVGDHFLMAEAILCSWVGKRYDQFWPEPKDYGHLRF